jgi:hypothetical protein
MSEVTGAFIVTLASANGIDLPEERVELVRREYENLMRSVAILDGLSIAAGTEPAIGQSLAPPCIAEPDGRR